MRPGGGGGIGATPAAAHHSIARSFTAGGFSNAGKYAMADDPNRMPAAASRAALGIGERQDLRRRLSPRQRAERLGDLEEQAARRGRRRRRSRRRNNGANRARRWRSSQRSSRTRIRSRWPPPSRSLANGSICGRRTSGPAMQPADRRVAPQHPPVVRKRKRLVVIAFQPADAILDLAGECPQRRRRHRSAGGSLGAARFRDIDKKAKAVECADVMAFDQDLAGGGDGGDQVAASAHVPDQRGRPAIDEALDQPLVQRVGQLVLDRPRPLLPAGASSSQSGRCET